MTSCCSVTHYCNKDREDCSSLHVSTHSSPGTEVGRKIVKFGRQEAALRKEEEVRERPAPAGDISMRRPSASGQLQHHQGPNLIPLAPSSGCASPLRTRRTALCKAQSRANSCTYSGWTAHESGDGEKATNVWPLNLGRWRDGKNDRVASRRAVRPRRCRR